MITVKDYDYLAWRALMDQNFPYVLTVKAAVGNQITSYFSAKEFCALHFGPDATHDDGKSFEFQVDVNARWSSFGHTFYFKSESDAILLKMAI